MSTKEAGRRASKKWREKNKQKRKLYHYERNEERKSFIDSMKTPCVACGEEDHICIDFHHIEPEKKSFAISKSTGRSIKSIKEEIEKCVCLCANCHRKLHAGKIDLGRWKYVLTFIKNIIFYFIKFLSNNVRNRPHKHQIAPFRPYFSPDMPHNHKTITHKSTYKHNNTYNTHQQIAQNRRCTMYKNAIKHRKLRAFLLIAAGRGSNNLYLVCLYLYYLYCYYV